MYMYYYYSGQMKNVKKALKSKPSALIFGRERAKKLDLRKRTL